MYCSLMLLLHYIRSASQTITEVFWLTSIVKVLMIILKTLKEKNKFKHNNHTAGNIQGVVVFGKLNPQNFACT